MFNPLRDPYHIHRTEKEEVEQKRVRKHVYVPICCFFVMAFFLVIVLFNIFFLVTAKPVSQTVTKEHPMALLYRQHRIGKGEKVPYYDSSRINKNYREKDNHHYACGNEVRYDFSIQIQHLLHKVNQTIKTGINTRAKKNRNMLMFYEGCMNVTTADEEVSEDIEILKGSTLKQLRENVEKIETKEHAMTLLARLEYYNFNTPFHVGTMNYFDRVLNRRTKVYTINPRTTPSPDPIRLKLNLYKHKRDEHQSIKQICKAASQIKTMYDFPIVKYLSRALREDIKDHNMICGPNSGFFRYFNDWIWNNDQYKLEDYKYMLRMSIDRTLSDLKVQIPEFLDGNTRSRYCFHKTVQYYPISYCKAAQRNSISYEQVFEQAKAKIEELQVSIFQNLKLIPGFAENNLNTLAQMQWVTFFESLDFQIGTCNDDPTQRQYKEESIPHVSYVRTILETGIHKSNEITGIQDIQSNQVRYDDQSRTVHIPLAMLIEYRYSIHYDEISQLGTFGFMVGHEIAHAVLDHIERYKPEAYQFIVDEYKKRVKQRTGSTVRGKLLREHICDDLSYQWNKVSKHGPKTEVDKEKYFITVAQLLCNEIPSQQAARERVNLFTM